ncbi:MAG: tRNA pseudouridine(13) synthase TruD [Cardiobacteriaceae bacterium]|nr:tRNA pseudouridine(13) synthase TruD [Cardiobacteriaceae bacterium]
MIEIKKYPSDFIVEELLDFELEEDGEHLFLYIEKNNLNTKYLCRKLADICQIPVREVAYSGLKDRFAITRQWISINKKYMENLPDIGKIVEEDGGYWQILDKKLHRKKLKIGSHKRNKFELTVRNISPEIKTVAEYKLQQKIFPNFFGNQRFGYNNLDEIRQLVALDKLPKKQDRTWLFSVLRSYLANIQIAMRIKNNILNKFISGDMAIFSNSNARFTVKKEEIDSLNIRAEKLEIKPSVCLIGKSEHFLEDTEIFQLTNQVLGKYQQEFAYLRKYAQQTDFRPANFSPDNLSYEYLDAETMRLNFTLPRGSFATVLIDEIFGENIAL